MQVYPSENLTTHGVLASKPTQYPWDLLPSKLENAFRQRTK